MLHRHPRQAGLIVFNDDGDIEHVFPFGPGEENVGADLPPGIWHTVVCLEQGSVFFETKPGPFVPITKKDLAPWAPEEGSLEARTYLQELVRVVDERTAVKA
jgi:cupin fold WbuC family metalloprotein